MKKEFMSITTVAQEIIERQAVAVAAADPQLLVTDYMNDANHDRADQRGQRGTTMIATFEVAGRFLTKPYQETDSHDLVDRKSAAEGTTFEVAKLPFRAT
jgi:hypothetical protein